MIDKQIYILHANICKALGSPLRIEIIDILNKSELNFGDILEKLKISKSNLSQHLSLMVANGILMQRKEGQNSYFKLSSIKVATACQIMREVLIDNINKNRKMFNLK